MFTYKTKTYGKGQKVVYLLSGWAFDRRFFAPVAYVLVLAGYTCTVYSYDASVLSPDIHKTIARFTEVKESILAKIAADTQAGKTPYAVFGTSLGAIIGLMVVNESPGIKKVILNLTGADIAETVWGWDIIKPWFKKALRIAGITLERLKKDWAPISPINNIDHLQGKDILLYLSEKDEVIPYTQGEKFKQSLEARGYQLQFILNRKRIHILAAAWNLIKFPVYIKFLKKTS